MNETPIAREKAKEILEGLGYGFERICRRWWKAYLHNWA